MLLVTGATGFVGRHVVKEIGKLRKDIRILSKDFEKAKEMYPKYEVFKGDITRPETLSGVSKDVDVVIHLAGIVSYSGHREDIFRINVKGTRNVLRACERSEKFIFASSVSVYGEIKGEADESYPRNPVNAYGESKREAENLVRDSGLKNLIFRIAPIYGEGSPVWGKNLRLLEKGFPIPRTNNMTHVTHIRNAVQAFRRGVEKKSEGVYNIADEKPVKFMEFAETLVRLLEREPRTLPCWAVSLLATVKGMKAYLDVLTMNRNYDIANARKDLKYRPELDFQKELRKMAGWYKQNKKNGN